MLGNGGRVKLEAASAAGKGRQPAVTCTCDSEGGTWREISWWSALLLLLLPEIHRLTKTDNSGLGEGFPGCGLVGGMGCPSCHLHPSLACSLAQSHREVTSILIPGCYGYLRYLRLQRWIWYACLQCHWYQGLHCCLWSGAAWHPNGLILKGRAEGNDGSLVYMYRDRLASPDLFGSAWKVKAVPDVIQDITVLAGQRFGTGEATGTSFSCWLCGPLVDHPPLAGDMFFEAVRAESPSAGGWLELEWFSGASCWWVWWVSCYSSSGWGHWCLACPTSIGQGPLSACPNVDGLWATVRLSHIRDWFASLHLESVSGAGNGRSSVDASYTTALDIGACSGSVEDDHVHIWFAALLKSCHTHVRLRLKFGVGRSRILDAVWRHHDEGIALGCPLSTVLIAELHLPWCSCLESLGRAKPQLSTDNLKHVNAPPDVLHTAARTSDKYTLRWASLLPPQGVCSWAHVRWFALRWRGG